MQNAINVLYYTSYRKNKMKNALEKRNGGFTMTIVVIIVAIIILKFVFDIDVIEALYYVKDVLITIWNDFLSKPFGFLIDSIKSILSSAR